jgi:hypothetical protein
MLKCNYASKYLGRIEPKCNGGKPCKECVLIYKRVISRG